MSWRVVAAIAQKDLIDAIRNRYLLVALLTPLSVALLLRLMVPDIGSFKNSTIVVHDPGRSALVSQLRAVQQIKLVEVDSEANAKVEVEKVDADGGLVVPTNFDADVAAGKQPKLTAYLNNKKNQIDQARFRVLVERQVAALVERPPPAQLDWINVSEEPDSQTGGGINLSQMLLPLLLLLTFGMTGALVVPLLLVEEKEKRTMDFLLTSPARLTEVIAGKALTGVVYSVLIAGVLLAVNRKLVGNWPLTMLTILLGMILIVTIGLLMGSLFKTTMQINTWASLALLVLITPSFPFPGSPAVLDTAMRFIPTYYFVEALKMSLAGTSAPRLWGYLAVVLGCTVVTFLAVTWAMRREQN
ncbi:MAG TPA: ABC transporter permease [Pyrinomonadaceae bacterium]|nr:ABC transporter permease [Pyrinomonadaceae bacterium]